MSPTLDAALCRRLDPASSRPLAVAFSGGSDSLALLLLAKTWGERHGRPVVALTVDHGLHPDSGRWTLASEQAARRLGVPWRKLTWTGDKPATGLPAAARRARHSLLAEAARGIGARVILVGHTFDDRRESDLMRQQTPSLGYLHEWSPSPAWPEGRGVFLLRPLLSARRADLRTHLVQQGLGWLDDPANSDPRYARSRARAVLGAAPDGDEPATPDADDALKALASWVVATPDGRLCIAQDRLQGHAPTTLRRLVGVALLCAGGGDRPARRGRLDALVDRLLRPDPFVATLCGARIAVEARTAVFARELSVHRRGERDALPVTLCGPAPIVFDGRFEVRATLPGLSVAPLAGRIARLAKPDLPKGIPAYARGGLPALIDAQGGVSLPEPFGSGPGVAQALGEARLIGACAILQRESDLSALGADVAPATAPSYVRV